MQASRLAQGGPGPQRASGPKPSGSRPARWPGRAAASSHIATDQVNGSARAWLAGDPDLVVLGGANGCAKHGGRDPQQQRHSQQQHHHHHQQQQQHWEQQQQQQQHLAGGSAAPLDYPLHAAHNSGSTSDDERQGIPSSSCGPAGPSAHSAGGSQRIGRGGSNARRQRQQQQRQQFDGSLSSNSSSSSSTSEPSTAGSDAPVHNSRRQRQLESKDEQQEQQQQQQQDRDSSGRRQGAARRGPQPRPRRDRASLAWAQRVTGDIQACGDWRQLAAILDESTQQQQQGPDAGGGGGEPGGGAPRRLNHIHASALLSRTARVTSYHALPPDQLEPFHAFFCSALDLAFSVLPDCAPREVATILWAVARLGLHPGAPWLAAFLAAARDGGQLAAAAPRDAANVLWALARFNHRPAPDAAAALMAAAVGQWEQQQQREEEEEAAEQEVGQPPQQHRRQQWQQQRQRREGSGWGRDSGSRGDEDQQPCGQSLANSIWALATLGVPAPPGWLDAWLAAASQADLRAFTMQGLANSLWGLARLGAAPGGAWLDAACAAARRQLDGGRAKPGEVSMLLHSLCRLRAAPPPQLLASAQASMLGAGGFDGLSYAEAANALWALAMLGERPRRHWMRACLGRLAAAAGGADVQALSTSLYALVRCGAAPPARWWDAFWAALPAALGEPPSPPRGRGGGGGGGSWCLASPKSLAVLSMCLGKLRPPPPPPRTAECLSAALHLALRQRRLNSAELSNVVCGLAGMPWEVPGLAALLDAFESAAEAALPQMRAGEVAATAAALARLRHRPGDGLRYGVEAALLRARDSAATEAERGHASEALDAWARLEPGGGGDGAPAAAAAAAAATAATAAAPVPARRAAGRSARGSGPGGGSSSAAVEGGSLPHGQLQLASG